ncbi:MAG: hypothetical protein H0X65_01740 [Gemmatimonadetes bacterium]|nr:hypothetical protein [Gemmatimonadota bacterium]
MSRFDSGQPTDRPMTSPAPGDRAPRREPGGYAASRSARHRPTLSLHDFRTRHKARSLQLGWVGLLRSREV